MRTGVGAFQPCRAAAVPTMADNRARGKRRAGRPPAGARDRREGQGLSTTQHPSAGRAEGTPQRLECRHRPVPMARRRRSHQVSARRSVADRSRTRRRIERTSHAHVHLTIADGILMNRKPQGFALIDLIFVCGIIGLLASIALPRLTLAKSAAGAASAIGSMRAINSAELTFALTCGAGSTRRPDDARHRASGKQRTIHRRRDWAARTRSSSPAT